MKNAKQYTLTTVIFSLIKSCYIENGTERKGKRERLGESQLSDKNEFNVFKIFFPQTRLQFTTLLFHQMV